jgi:hypothetical protein
MGKNRLELLHGTLDIMVLQTPSALGALHGYGIARRIEQVSGEEVLLNQGTISPLSCGCNSGAGFPPHGAFRITIAKPGFTRSPAAAGNGWRRKPSTGRLSGLMGRMLAFPSSGADK